ncbi:MAG: glycosyltransferase family 4 protein [Deltaproteobacteria bacterium]|nr:glycosyltransferase family 4 protein [Deltaproteobacteria bacterium]
MEKLKIGILTEWFWPLIGGPAIHTYELIEWLIQKGHEVHLLIFPTDYSKLSKRDLLDLPCIVHCIRYPERGNFYGDYTDKWTFIFEMAFRNARYVWDLNLDILHGHTPMSSYLTTVLGKMINLPTLITLHLNVNLALSIAKKCISRCQYMEIDKCLGCDGITDEKIWNIGIKKFFIQSADRIITPSVLIKNILIKHYKFKDNVSCVPFWVDLSRFELPRKDAALLKKFKINKKQRAILYCGHILKIKGVEYLIRAMPEILKKVTNCKLLITGKIYHKDRFYINIRNLIKQLKIENDVVFVGRVEYGSIPKLYSIADLLILPSLEEAQPLVLLEAMAAKIPIIANSLDTIKEFIDDGKNGILVNEGNSEEISKAAIRIFKSNRLRQRLVQNGYGTVEEKFSKDRIIPKILKVYKQEISNYFHKP